MDTRAAILAHLRFLEELGVDGICRDANWTCRAMPHVAGAGNVQRSAGTDAAAGTPMHARRAIWDVAAGTTLGLFDNTNDRVESLDDIRRDLGECIRCKLHRAGRRHIVFGTGHPRAALMFVGEAPGHDEDEQGVPFVGRAGQLLTRIIESIGLRREEVYIANVIKCRPPENRNPEPDEVIECERFLLRQVQSIRPRVIVVLGTFAARTVLRTIEPISKLRGRVYKYGRAFVVPTFHPAYLLRSPERKRDVWEDMKVVRALLAEEADGEDR